MEYHTCWFQNKFKVVFIFVIKPLLWFVIFFNRSKMLKRPPIKWCHGLTGPR